jgi:CRISPR/Cas system-associated exonuclease Cas4 (RecB family)
LAEKIGTPLSRVLAMRTGDWLGAAVDNFLEKSAEGRDDPGWIHPSELSNTCDAFLGFSYLGIPKQVSHTARLRRIFDNGHGRDYYWKQYFHDSGLSLIKKEEDRKVEIGPLHIRGELDDLIRNPVTQEGWVAEIKTMNAEQWKALTAPLGNHILQVHPYMFATGVMRTIFIYENKNTQEVKYFSEHFRADLWNSLAKRTESIIDQIEHRIVPDRKPAKYETSCPYHYCCASWMFPEVAA